MREIKPNNNNGSIQLRFSFDGKRYIINPIPGGSYTNKRDLATAQAIATKIQNDILAGCFDPTLDRYRLTPKAPPPPPTPTKPKTLLELWDAWVSTLDLPDAVKADHYEWVRRSIVKANPGAKDTLWFTQSTLAAATFNDRLSYLRSCGRWAVKEGLLENNPWEFAKARKGSRKPIKPFTIDEIQLILKGFQEQAPHYIPFVAFLLLTGTRLAEAIGLRWCHVDFDRNELTICESLPKDILGNGYRRVRKTTKTGTFRVLSMNPELRQLLLALKPPSATPDRLVFTSAEGCIIDADNFRARQWKPILTACGIPYRKPHTTRHTTLSHAIEQGIPVTGVAYIAGHKDTRMVVQTYGHMVNRPKLPDMPV